MRDEGKEGGNQRRRGRKSKGAEAQPASEGAARSGSCLRRQCLLRSEVPLAAAAAAAAAGGYRGDRPSAPVYIGGGQKPI